MELDKVHPGFLEMISLAPDEEKLVYVTNPKTLDDARVWITQADGSNPKEVAKLGSDLWIVPPIWSPTSEKLAYVLFKRNAVGKSGIELWTMNADGSSQTKLVYDHPSFTADLFVGNPYDVIHWTADSAHIRYVNYNAMPPRIYEVDVKSGELKSWKSVDIINERRTDNETSISSLPCSVTRFSQQDPDFQPELYTASCLGDYTMASGGCAITSLAMMLKYYGVNTNPRILDDTLGSSRCPLSNHWNEVATVGGAGSDVTYVGALDGDRWDILQSELANGKPVVVRMFRASNGGNHYVLVIDGSGSSHSNYTIADPWCYRPNCLEASWPN